MIRTAPPALALVALAAFAGAEDRQRADFHLRDHVMVPAGTVRSGSVQLLGGSLQVMGRVTGSVAALAGTVRVEGVVEGDVLVAGGRVVLGPQARVGGDLLSLSGDLEERATAVVSGRRFHLASSGGIYRRMILGQGAEADSSATPLFLGLRLALLTIWLLISIPLVLLWQPRIGMTAFELAARPLRSLATGLLGIATFSMIAALLLLAAALWVGLPLLALLLIIAVGIKIAGMVAVFEVVGEWTRRRLPALVGSTPLSLVATGCLVLGLLRLLPGLGSLLWMVASLAGIGAVLVRASHRLRRPRRLDAGPRRNATPAVVPLPIRR